MNQLDTIVPWRLIIFSHAISYQLGTCWGYWRILEGETAANFLIENRNLNRVRGITVSQGILLLSNAWNVVVVNNLLEWKASRFFLANGNHGRAWCSQINSAILRPMLHNDIKLVLELLHAVGLGYAFHEFLIMHSCLSLTFYSTRAMVHVDCLRLQFSLLLRWRELGRRVVEVILLLLDISAPIWR